MDNNLLQQTDQWLIKTAQGLLERAEKIIDDKDKQLVQCAKANEEWQDKYIIIKLENDEMRKLIRSHYGILYGESGVCPSESCNSKNYRPHSKECEYAQILDLEVKENG